MQPAVSSEDLFDSYGVELIGRTPPQVSPVATQIESLRDSQHNHPIVIRPFRSELRLTIGVLAIATVFSVVHESAPAQFESLGIPVKAGGLMGCIVGPNGRGGEALKGAAVPSPSSLPCPPVMPMLPSVAFPVVEPFCAINSRRRPMPPSSAEAVDTRSPPASSGRARSGKPHGPPTGAASAGSAAKGGRRLPRTGSTRPARAVPRAHG